MNQDRLFQDFPISVRCESKDTIVFVACPVGGRYGDVRKTLAGLLQHDVTTLGIAPMDESSADSGNANSGDVQLFDDNLEVSDENHKIVIRARIFERDVSDHWVAM